MAARGSSSVSMGATRILDVAERLAQTRGFNGFSYADIASALDVTKASLHYHFATKAELGRALISRYHDVFGALLADIDARATGAADKLHRYAALYRGVLSDDRMCLCGMLAAEHQTLPRPMRDEVRRFFTMNEAWLAAVVEEGARANELRPSGKPLDTARHLLSALQGAMLVARSYGSTARFDVVAKRLVDELVAGELSPKAGRRRTPSPARTSTSRGAPRPRRRSAQGP